MVSFNQVKVFLFILILKNVFAEDLDSNPYLHRVRLDPKGNYFLEWMVDWKQNRTIFSVTAKTLGYVGFGLSRTGKMSGSDLILGGVAKGKPYFSDKHVPFHSQYAPVVDQSQNWDLHAAWENSSHTFLSFSRKFDTCDEDDLEINDDTVALIWAFGETDDVSEYHHANRGSYLTYLLGPDLTPNKVRSNQFSTKALSKPGKDGQVQIWTISGSKVIPERETSYICSVHKAPTESKSHIIGFNAVLPTEFERRHIHHFILYHCNVPSRWDVESVFEPVLNLQEFCYILDKPRGRIRTNFCKEIYFVWGLGQPPFFLPEHTGLPISESGSDYFMLQMHFDNPHRLQNLKLNYALEVFISKKLREHDAGVLNFGQVWPGSPGILIPPNSLQHEIYGHCGSSCTKSMFPKEGIKAVAVNLHSHYAGRKMALRHVRDGKELPVLMKDDNYFPTYQTIRVFQEERVILPGDQLINTCVYENTDRYGSVTVGGFSTRQEMCQGLIYYYNRIKNRGFCGSEIRSDLYRTFLQIYNATWSDEALEMIVQFPERYKGLTVSQVGNQINWTIKKRRKLQRLHRYLPQITMCPPTIPEFTDSEDFSEEFSSEESEETFEEALIKLNNDFSQYKNEIVDSEYEFVSVFNPNVKRYQKKPLTCIN